MTTVYQANLPARIGLRVHNLNVIQSANNSPHTLKQCGENIQLHTRVKTAREQDSMVKETGNVGKCSTHSNKRRSSIEELLEKVGDIDSLHRGAFSVPYYAKDILNYLFSLELKYPIKRDYLRIPERLIVTPRMHMRMFDWMVWVHSSIKMQPETLYLAFEIVDQYMCSHGGPDVLVKEYQLLGLGALFIACKYEENCSVPTGHMVFTTDYAYKPYQLLRAEMEILNRLDFFLGYPLPTHFLDRYSNVCGATPLLLDLAAYIMEAGRSNYGLVHVPASALAAASLCASVELLAGSNGGGREHRPSSWTEALEAYSGYSREALRPFVRLVVAAVRKSRVSATCKNLRCKFAKMDRNSVSCLPALQRKNPFLQRLLDTGALQESN